MMVAYKVLKFRDNSQTHFFFNYKLFFTYVKKQGLVRLNLGCWILVVRDKYMLNHIVTQNASIRSLISHFGED